MRVRISSLPFCFCWKSPAIRHLADSMVLTMLVERTLKMEKNRSWKAANLKIVEHLGSYPLYGTRMYQNCAVQKSVCFRPHDVQLLTRPRLG